MLQKTFTYLLIGLILASSSGITLHYHQCLFKGSQLASIFANNTCKHNHSEHSDNYHCNSNNKKSCDLSYSLENFNCESSTNCNLDYPINYDYPEYKSLCCSEYSEFYSIDNIFQNKIPNEINFRLCINSIRIQLINDNQDFHRPKIKEFPSINHLDFRDIIISYIHKTSRITNSDISDFNIC